MCPPNRNLDPLMLSNLMWDTLYMRPPLIFTLTDHDLSSLVLQVLREHHYIQLNNQIEKSPVYSDTSSVLRMLTSGTQDQMGKSSDCMKIGRCIM